MRPATNRAVNCRGSTGVSTADNGNKSTPARPASRLDSAHALPDTAGLFTPSSCARRRLSTTARISNPKLLHRNMAITAATTATVITVVESSLPLMGVEKRWK